jgi:hypothetical protein
VEWQDDFRMSCALSSSSCHNELLASSSAPISTAKMLAWKTKPVTLQSICQLSWSQQTIDENLRSKKQVMTDASAT